jgi:hypothetical protein
MSKTKNIIDLQQEHEDEVAKYYSHLYKVAGYMGIEKICLELIKANTNFNPKKDDKRN